MNEDASWRTFESFAGLVLAAAKAGDCSSQTYYCACGSVVSVAGFVITA
jgi:hypothetical protein